MTICEPPEKLDAQTVDNQHWKPFQFLGSLHPVGRGWGANKSRHKFDGGRGSFNTASGNNSFAAGYGAQALHQGAFVWGDSQNAAFTSTRNDQFSIRATGGVRALDDGLSAKRRREENGSLASFTLHGLSLCFGTRSSAELSHKIQVEFLLNEVQDGRNKSCFSTFKRRPATVLMPSSP
jgi:hypothetical protein